jgi:hypothetical protein
MVNEQNKDGDAPPAKAPTRTSAPPPPAAPRRYLRNELNSVVTITWGNGAHAVEFPRRGSLPVDALPDGFLGNPEVLRRLKAIPAQLTIYEG